ncbi:MAG: hypothetical protein SPH18_03900 [Sutterella parvirubra]|nr:hypothetical protein [Sutterella parvirubra]
MTNNMHAPNERPAQKGHGLFDVLPQRHDPLPEGKWIYNDGELRCIEVVGDEAVWHLLDPFRGCFVFYPLFTAWLLIYYSGIGFALKKLGCSVPSTSMVQWVYDYPNLWSCRFHFDRSNFLSTFLSDEFDRKYLRWKRRIERRNRLYMRRYMNSRF